MHVAAFLVTCSYSILIMEIIDWKLTWNYIYIYVYMGAMSTGKNFFFFSPLHGIHMCVLNVKSLVMEGGNSLSYWVH